ncbi:MAG: hypothetical protein ABIQ16_20605 [Polyangiaceae bacterium]
MGRSGEARLIALAKEFARAFEITAVTGLFAAGDSLSSLGIQCAFCHSTVDDS